MRAIHVPRVARGLLYEEASNQDNDVTWLGALAAYSLAHERTLFERLYRAKNQAGFDGASADELENWSTAKLGASTLNWFDHTREGFSFWLSRFDQWRMYALKSADHYIASQSIDYRRTDGKQKQAVHLGILKLLNALPEDRIGQLLKETDSNSAARKIYLKNAKKRPTAPAKLALRSWLIECWPLVLEYGWSYREIQLVAQARFESCAKNGEDQLGFHFTTDYIKGECQKLGLKLAFGRRKVGRCRAELESVLPLMHQVALLVDGLEDHADWFWGGSRRQF